ncbi:MAG: universal stress protein [Kiloniellales bacterium]
MYKNILLTVVPNLGMTVVGQFFPEDFEKNVVEETEKQLAAFVAQRLPPGIEAQPMVALGTIYEEILAAAERTGADLIVMAAHRPGVQDYLLGPNAARVVRHFKGSVMVVRD